MVLGFLSLSHITIVCYNYKIFFINRKSNFGILFEIKRVVRIERVQIVLVAEEGGVQTMETKLTANKEKLLSKVANALEQIPSTSTEENRTIKNIILEDLVQLENSVSSGSISLYEVNDVNGSQNLEMDYIVLENPMAYTHRLN